MKLTNLMVPIWYAVSIAQYSYDGFETTWKSALCLILATAWHIAITHRIEIHVIHAGNKAADRAMGHVPGEEKRDSHGLTAKDWGV